jgi:hypothetical protein
MAKTKVAPYRWAIGIDNMFGWLTLPDGSEHLVESRRFCSGEGIAISLLDGKPVIAVADGTASWEFLKPEVACDLAGLPLPAVDGDAEVKRRLNPFHVERHASAEFLALTEAIREDIVPCGHALRMWNDHQWDSTFDYSNYEIPEVFACSVLERMVRDGTDLQDAVCAELLGDLSIDPSNLGKLLELAGWEETLVRLHGLVDKYRQKLDRPVELCRTEAA